MATLSSMAGCSPVQLAKRALVVLLRALAITYGLQLDVTRDSSDDVVTKAFRKLAVKVHPDKGGSTQDSQRLLAARDEWMNAMKETEVGEKKRSRRGGETSP